ncbi:MAG: signal peptidase [Marmoricola sp.]|nr:signal peptidase [Marmoricola sp.]
MTLEHLGRRAGPVALTIGAVVGSLCILLAVVAMVLDLRVLAFRSGSMAPTIRTGALAVTRNVPAAGLEVGDIVSVRTASGSRVTHRIVQVTHTPGSATLELRGDANHAPDAAPYVVSHADRVLFSVPWLGYAGAVLVSPLGLFLLGLYAAVLVRVLTHRRPPYRPGHRHDLVTASTRILAVVVGTAAIISAAATSRADTTLASWVDSAATTGSAFSTATEAAPVTFTCGLLGLFTLTFSWSAVAGATSYTLHYGSGGASTTSVTGTTATITAVISGGTAWVTASKDYGSTTWTSAASTTRSYSVLAVSVCS